jgi:CO/xanthine dehydrogenase Mo-binding subunit
LKNLVFIVDVGRAINPTTVEGQMQGGIAQAIGITLTEDYYFNKNGALESDNFTTYKIPSSLDMPNIDLLIYEQEPPKSGPFGAKGVGESPMISVTPAIANAIYNAVGVRIEKMPITPERILQALKEKSKEK